MDLQWTMHESEDVSSEAAHAATALQWRLQSPHRQLMADLGQTLPCATAKAI